MSDWEDYGGVPPEEERRFDSHSFNRGYECGKEVGISEEQRRWGERLEILKAANRWGIWSDDQRIGERAIAIMEGRWEEYAELLAFVLAIEASGPKGTDELTPDCVRCGEIIQTVDGPRRCVRRLGHEFGCDPWGINGPNGPTGPAGTP